MNAEPGIAFIQAARGLEVTRMARSTDTSSPQRPEEGFGGLQALKASFFEVFSTLGLHGERECAYSVDPGAL